MSALYNPDTRILIGVACDAPDCEIVAPEQSIIMKHHGLINLGWYCKGGTHLCPDHKDEPHALHSPR